MRVNLLACVAIIVFVGSFTKYAEGQASLPPLDLRILFVPDAVTISGKTVMYYEIHLANASPDTIDLDKLQVLRTSDSSVVLTIEDLEDRILLPFASNVIYIEYDVSGLKTGTGLFHRLQCRKMGNLESPSFSVDGADFDVKPVPAIALRPPLSGGPWAAIYEPSWERGHRRVIYTVDDKARIPGRFAIDFIRLNNSGQYADGNEDEIKNWLGYSAPVLAVADGIVLSIRNDFKESNTVSGHPSVSAGDATGNYISIGIGSQYVAFYEHLKPGSIRVRPGQKVKKGDIIASLGFTGQTTGPHLHFHIADKNSPLGAEGIPFVFEYFMMLGSYKDLEKFGHSPWIPLNGKPQEVKGERPPPNSVLNFER